MAAEIAGLAVEAARSLGCEAGVGAAQAVICAGMLQLGGAMLGRLLAACPGYPDQPNRLNDLGHLQI